ncbi:MAG: hypothetical protein IJD64_06560 [Clostridia bacterium]|nr:hypothetical protein [Clostridia bacterium]
MSQYNPTVGGWTKPPVEEDEGKDSKDPIDDSKVPEDEWTYLVKGGAPQFVVVAASEQYDALAEEFAENLKGRTSVAFTYVKSANKETVGSKNQIVLGESLGKVLGPGETLTYNGKLSRLSPVNSEYIKIHITGNHKDAVAASKQKFLSGCLARYLVKEHGRVTFKVPNPRIFFLEENLENYVTTTPKILGRDLAEYKIVFPKDMTAIDHYMATYLLSEIGAKTGLVMRTVTDATTEAECEIVFGKTSRAGSQALYDTLKQGEFAIKSEGTKIYVAYENYLVASNARGALNKLYLDKVTTPINIRQTPDYKANCVTKNDDSYVRVMTSNIICAGDADGRKEFDEKRGITWQHRVQLQGSMMMAYLPDFIGLQEMQEGYTYVDALMHTELKKMISSEYTFVEYEGMAQNTYWNPIVYRHNVWKLEEKGTMYPMNFNDTMHRWQWALFSRIDDPTQKVIILNLHYPISKDADAQLAAAQAVNEVIRELQDTYYTASLFVTGDFNAGEGSATYEATVGDTTLKNANLGNGAIDLVLYDRTFAELKTGYLIKDTFIQNTSDHKPFFGDFELN